MEMNLRKAIEELSETQPDGAELLEATLEELEQLNGIVKMITGGPEEISIPADEHEKLVRESERLRLIENYILNNEYCSNDTLRAMVGYTGEE